MLKTSSKISIAIFILILLALSVYGFLFFKDRDSSPTINRDSNPAQTSEPTQNTQTSADPGITDNSAVDSIVDSEEVTDENTPIENNNFLDISKTDCSNLCKDFTDFEDLKYCQQICGITPIKKDVTEKKGCDALNDLEKDYCLKDLAIVSNDLSICQSIDDSNVKKTCRNRIAENLSGLQQ
jgi:hypothetical protein